MDVRLPLTAIFILVIELLLQIRVPIRDDDTLIIAGITRGTVRKVLNGIILFLLLIPLVLALLAHMS